MSLTFGSLFAGIGGFDLGFERAGMVCKWQVEIDTYAQRVLAKHWPDVRRHDDVRTFPPAPASDWRVDVICGGFPCQDISAAGHCEGIDGARSGLWAEFHRIIRALRPRFVAVENVAALVDRGIDRVLGDLAEAGFDAEWQVLPAKAFGAPHTRERMFIVAYSGCERRETPSIEPRIFSQGIRKSNAWGRSRFRELELNGVHGKRVRSVPRAGVLGATEWLPDWMDRLRCSGNAVVPQVAEWIGRRIAEASQAHPPTNGARR